MGRQATLVGQKTPQEIEPLLAPHPDFDEVLHPAQRRAQHEQQDFG